MRFSPQPALQLRGAVIRTSDTLTSWYAATPAVQCLWAISPVRSNGESALRVLVMLQPTADSDETTPIWMARREQWALELSQQLDGVVQLERIDGPPDAFELDDAGTLVCTLSWRDPTSLS